VLVTRPRGQAGRLAAALERAGHRPVLCPLIEIEPLGDEAVDTSGYDWLVVTSANGARELARRRAGALPRVAAVGPATAEALRAAGIEPSVVAATPSQEGLLEALPSSTGRVLFAGAEGARRLLVDALDADFVALYRTRELGPTAVPDADVAVLSSPSAARALARLRLGLPVVTVGPHTTREARRLGLEVAAEAARPDPESVAAAISTLGAP
jgi:uroporphyrinogen-III synthase